MWLIDCHELIRAMFPQLGFKTIQIIFSNLGSFLFFLNVFSISKSHFFIPFSYGNNPLPRCGADLLCSGYFSQSHAVLFLAFLLKQDHLQLVAMGTK